MVREFIGNRRLAWSAVLAAAITAQSILAAPLNFWGSYMGGNSGERDPNKPQTSRANLTTKVEETATGYRFIVDLWQMDKSAKTSLYLQAAVNDGKGSFQAVTFLQLDNAVKDNPTGYHSRREFEFTLAELNAAWSRAAGSAAPHLRIEPGTPLFVLGHWPDYHHNWGGVGRGGIVVLPGTPTQSTQALPAARRPTELDLAYEITAPMADAYNENRVGLKQGGQIRSRLESEGKYQVRLDELVDVKKALFALADDPAKAKAVLGPDWTIAAETRYMRKDPSGNLIRDANGLPVPDPMVDTYYDSANLDAAKNDMAIRYRWTEGNQTGSWNFKPGLTQASPEGVVDRIEFGVDTTDDKPETVKKFADSADPLNPFGLIREVIPGATPSEFLLPSVKVTDTRFKFKLKHKNGLVIEISLDDVQVQSLRGTQAQARFGQLEMDIDHLSTTSANVARGVSSAKGLDTTIDNSMRQFLDGLTKDAFFDGRPVVHTVADLEATSPVKAQHQADFGVASSAIASLRNHLLGQEWMAGPQKYAVAAYALGLLSGKEASRSVRGLLAKEARAEQTTGRKIQLFETPGAASCGVAFGK